MGSFLKAGNLRALKIDSKPVAASETLQWALNQADDEETRLLLHLQFPYWLFFLQHLSSLPNKMPLNSEGLQLYLLDLMHYFFPRLQWWLVSESSVATLLGSALCVLNKKLDTFKSKTCLKKVPQRLWNLSLKILTHSNPPLCSQKVQLWTKGKLWTIQWLNKERISRQRHERGAGEKRPREEREEQKESMGQGSEKGIAETR